MIKFEQSELWLGNFKAFDALNLSIKEGKHVRIVGANGSGKTLLARAIVGQLKLKAGSIEIRNNQSLNEIATYVPARTFETLFNASSNLFYQQRYYGTANVDIQTAGDYLGDSKNHLKSFLHHKDFDLRHLYPVKITGLSNGQLRKLVMLKAISCQPKVLVLDYPYDGLDAMSRGEFNLLLEEIVRLIHCTLVIVDNDNELPNLSFEKLLLKEMEITKQADDQTKPFKINWGRKPDKVSNPIVELRQVSVKYGSKQVLSEFNWCVKRGERWLLTGANGSGKSTILSLIFADHPQAYTNHIALFGKKRGSGESIWDIKNRISFLSAEMFTYATSSFKNNQRVEAFLLTHFHGPFEGENLDPKIIKNHMFEYLAYFGILHTKNQLFRTLSSGYKQVLLIIRTFLFKNELILLDEPFEFLDQAMKEKAKQFILEHVQDNDTLIVISHHGKSEFAGIENVIRL